MFSQFFSFPDEIDPILENGFDSNENLMAIWYFTSMCENIQDSKIKERLETKKLDFGKLFESLIEKIQDLISNLSECEETQIFEGLERENPIHSLVCEKMGYAAFVLGYEFRAEFEDSEADILKFCDSITIFLRILEMFDFGNENAIETSIRITEFLSVKKNAPFEFESTAIKIIETLLTNWKAEIENEDMEIVSNFVLKRIGQYPLPIADEAFSFFEKFHTCFQSSIFPIEEISSLHQQGKGCEKICKFLQSFNNDA